MLDEASIKERMQKTVENVRRDLAKIRTRCEHVADARKHDDINFTGVFDARQDPQQFLKHVDRQRTSQLGAVESYDNCTIDSFRDDGVRHFYSRAK